MFWKKRKTKSKRNAGFSLVELIIAMSIFLIGIAAVYNLMKFATLQRNTVSSRTDQLRSVRIALEYIRRDVLNAGFGYHRTGGNVQDNTANSLFGISSDSDTERDLITSILAGNNINPNNLNFSAMTDTIVLLSRDTTFNNRNVLIYKTAVTSGSGILVTSKTPGDVSACNKYDLYLFESAGGTTQVLGMLTTKVDNNSFKLERNSDDPFGVNQRADLTGQNQSLLATTPGEGIIKRVNMVSYSVTPEGVLIRRRFGNQTGMAANQQIETRELVFGVSDFQIKYFMEDGTTVDDPSLGNNGRTNQMRMNNVVQVQISITMAAETDSQPRISTPITLREYVSTKNLRYEQSE